MKIISKQGFFYLKHSFRKDGNVKTRGKYLGKTIPQNIETIKSQFLQEIINEQLYEKLTRIKKEFQKEWKKYPPSIQKKYLIDLSVKFTYNSNAIEGSTITRDETEDIIKHKISPHKSLADTQETILHSRVFLNAISLKTFNLKTLLSWHKELFAETKQDMAGKVRDYIVSVGDYRTPDWQDLEDLLKSYFKWLRQNKKMNPVQLAARAHYKFEKIHPFGDGNGRIGRLIIAQILKSSGYPILVVEYKKRKSYYRALGKTEDKFVNYLMQRYLKSFKHYLENSSK